MAFYGPTNRLATKLVVGITTIEGGDSELFKWFDETVDIRSNARILDEVTKLLAAHKIKSVFLCDKLFGCPHEQGIDYEDEWCPQCPWWHKRDRFTHLKIDDPANKAATLANLGANLYQ